jgi:hypothetical protein
MPDTALPKTSNYFFVPAPLTVQQLKPILAGVESEDERHPIDPKYPTNSWITHVYSAKVKDPPTDGYVVLFDIPPVDDDGTHPVQVASVAGANDEEKANEAALVVGRGNDLIGYEDFGPQRGVIYRNTGKVPPAVSLPSGLSWDTSAPREQWSAKLLSLVNEKRTALEAGDANSFIAGYDTLSPEGMKLKFWAELFVAISKFESGWNPKNVFGEPPPLNVNSVGLLQLSQQDQNNYQVTPHVNSEEQLKDPLLNLQWGVSIFAHLLERDRVVASGTGNSSRGAARYWSVLRVGHKISAIAAITKANVGL